MNPVQRLRLEADKVQIARLCASDKFSGTLSVVEPASALAPRWQFRLAVHTIASAASTEPKLEQFSLEIRMGSHYPFQAPTAHLMPVPFHPNVFPSGVICLGTTWSASEGLDLLIERIARLLQFDPLLVNTASPANSQAARWFQEHQRRYPSHFPCDVHANKAKRVQRSCPQCQTKLSLPVDRSGEVACPRCHHAFFAST